MALARIVKVGNISNLSDARYCAGMGVDMLGFRVIESQNNFMSAKQFQEIRGWVTGPRIVAEIYGIDSAETMTSILNDYRPDVIELGLEELKVIKDIKVPYILSVFAEEIKSTVSLKNSPAYLLVKDFKNGVEKSSIPMLVELNSLKLEDIEDRYS